MAVPHVSGTAALMHRRAACSATDPVARGDRSSGIESTARDLGPPGYDITYGCGPAERRARRPRRSASRRRRRRGRSGSPDDQHRAGRVVGDLVRHAAEQEALGAGHALVADHDQVGVLLLGDVEDRVRRLALAGEGAAPRRRPPRPPWRPRRASRRRPRCGPTVCSMSLGRLEPLLAQPRLRHRARTRSRCQSDAPVLLRELGRLAHRLLGGLRAVRPDHDASEHLPSSQESDAATSPQIDGCRRGAWRSLDWNADGAPADAPLLDRGADR